MWQPIETAPMDGSKVWVKRVYEGRIVKEGWAVFAVCDPFAAQRKPLGPDPLGRLSNNDYAREAQETLAYAERPKWFIPDLMYFFPQPTHWHPAKTKEAMGDLIIGQYEPPNCAGVAGARKPQAMQL